VEGREPPHQPEAEPQIPSTEAMADTPTAAVGSLETMFQRLTVGADRPPTDARPNAGKYDPLWQLSMADPHTGLVNQLLLHDRLSQALSRRERHGGQVVVMHVDLVNLGDIHAEFGYSVGKDVVCELSRRLTSSLRNEDTVGRTSGTELVVVMTIDDATEAGILVERLQQALFGPVRVSGRSVLVSAAIGVAVAKKPESADEVLARADRAA
jgi:diguanylate cyclase (GGDEF)-like protein